MPSKPPPFVFVSYTHDSQEHKDRVLSFSRFLVQNRIDVCLDQWHLRHRRDWYRWAIENIGKADFVLAVASANYRDAADGKVTHEDNRGLQAEAAMLRELLQQDRPKWTRRILPVLLPGHRPGEIPLFLQPLTADHYHVTDLSVAGAEDLLRVLTDQPPHVAPERGEHAPVLPPHSPSTPFAPPAGNVQHVVSYGNGPTIANQGGNQNIHL